MINTEITILNSMAGNVFEVALDQHVSWDIKCLDLKDNIFGKSIIELTEEEARHAAELIHKEAYLSIAFPQSFSATILN